MEILTDLTNKAVRYGFVVACVVIGCAAWPSALNADPIPTLYNTGVNDDYELLDDLAPDPHYKLVVNPDSDLIHPFVVKSDEFPIPPWLANGPDSKWLAVREGENANGINGNYTYRTSFDLTGIDLEKIVSGIKKGILKIKVSGDVAAPGVDLIAASVVGVPISPPGPVKKKETDKGKEPPPGVM